MTDEDEENILVDETSPLLLSEDPTGKSSIDSGTGTDESDNGETGDDKEDGSAEGVDTSSSSNNNNNNDAPLTRRRPSPPEAASVLRTGRLLLLVVAVLYGSLAVSLRMVYARPGPPAASILSATRGWMTVLCLLPVILARWCRRNSRNGLRSSPSPSSSPPSTIDPPVYSAASFYRFALELAVFNFGTQGLLNIGLLTTESARSAFFTQLSVVITPVLAAIIGCCRKRTVVVPVRVWIASFLALYGLYVLSLTTHSSDIQTDTDSDSDIHTDSDVDVYSDTDADDDLLSNITTAIGVGETGADTREPTSTPSMGQWWDGAARIAATVTAVLNSLSFGDWCCLGSALSWSCYIYRLSDWGDRYDETQTMLVKNVFLALLYTLWSVVAYFLATPYEDDNTGGGAAGGFSLWEGWRDPLAWSILFYTALTSGAVSDVLQQTGQSRVPAAESNVILSLEPVVAAVLGLVLLREIPSLRECLGGGLIILASILASSNQ